HLSRNHDAWVADHEPTQIVVTGRPALDRTQIRRILAVKLDHIGDCITAFPAIRRLQQHFPDARISVLTSAASRAVWSMAPSVAETIDFDFFQPVSGLGQIELGEEDWRLLRERLAGSSISRSISENIPRHGRSC